MPSKEFGRHGVQGSLSSTTSSTSSIVWSLSPSSEVLRGSSSSRTCEGRRSCSPLTKFFETTPWTWVRSPRRRKSCRPGSTWSGIVRTRAARKFETVTACDRGIWSFSSWGGSIRSRVSEKSPSVWCGARDARTTSSC